MLIFSLEAGIALLRDYQPAYPKLLRPCKKRANSEGFVVWRPGEMSAPSTTVQRLLVIDDDRKLCRLIADYLGPLGYEVTAVHTGPEGVERGASGEWAAIILDVMLPAMDGFEVL